MSETKYTEVHNMKKGFQIGTLIEHGKGQKDPVTTLHVKGITIAGGKKDGEIEKMTISDLTDLKYLLEEHLMEVRQVLNKNTKEKITT